jgi:hypothetical protein
VRVRDKDTGHSYDISPATFDADAHELLNSDAYPDLFSELAQPRPPKHRTDKAGQPVTNQKET